MTYGGWYETQPADLLSILTRASAEGLRAYPVSTRVNSVRNDDASLIEAASASPRSILVDAADENVAIVKHGPCGFRPNLP